MLVSSPVGNGAWRRPLMRLLFYNQAGQLSGAERVLLTMLEHLTPADADLLLCAPPGALQAAARRAGVAVTTTAPLTLGRTRNPLLLARYGVAALRPAADLRRAVRQFRPAILYANTLRSGLVSAVALRALSPRPRLVVHLHDPVQDGLLDHLAARVVARAADQLIAVSQFAARGFASDAGKVEVLYNAIDPERYRSDTDRACALRQRLDLPREAPLLAVVGQITPWKGQREALEAFARVRAQVPAAHLLLAGSAKFSGRHRRYDTEAYWRALAARAQQPDLVGTVHMPGEVADVRAVYSAVTALLIPSWFEAFAVVVLEGMAAGCPIIATAAGGTVEIIRHGVNGWLVPPRNPDALADGTLRLLHDDALRRALASAAQLTIRERFTIPPFMARVRQLLGITPA